MASVGRKMLWGNSARCRGLSAHSAT